MRKLKECTYLLGNISKCTYHAYYTHVQGSVLASKAYIFRSTEKINGFPKGNEYLKDTCLHENYSLEIPLNL